MAVEVVVADTASREANNHRTHVAGSRVGISAPLCAHNGIGELEQKLFVLFFGSSKENSVANLLNEALAFSA